MQGNQQSKLMYQVMLDFLETYAGSTLDLTMGELLGSMAISEDGISMDPAALSIWNDTYSRAVAALVNISKQE